MFIGDNGIQTIMLGKILSKIESMEAANKNLTRKIINIEHEVKQNGEKLDEIMNHMGLPAPTKLGQLVCLPPACAWAPLQAGK